MPEVWWQKSIIDCAPCVLPHANSIYCKDNQANIFSVFSITTSRLSRPSILHNMFSNTSLWKVEFMNVNIVGVTPINDSPAFIFLCNISLLKINPLMFFFALHTQMYSWWRLFFLYLSPVRFVTIFYKRIFYFHI